MSDLRFGDIMEHSRYGDVLFGMYIGTDEGHNQLVFVIEDGYVNSEGVATGDWRYDVRPVGWRKRGSDDT